MLRLTVDDIQGGSKGFILTCLLGMHSAANEFIAVLILSACTFILSFYSELQSITDAFCRKRS